VLTRFAVTWPKLCLALAALLSLSSLLVAGFILDINTDENDLFSGDLAFVERRSEYYQTLPVMADPIVVALESALVANVSADELNNIAFELAEKLSAHKDLFTDVIGLADPEFRNRAGLLYLEEDAQYDVLDKILEAQPLLGSLSQDPSLGGLLTLLNRLLEPALSVEERSQRIDQTSVFLGRFANTLDQWNQQTPGQLNWSALFNNESETDNATRIIFFVLPVVDYASMDPAATAIKTLRSIANTLPEINTGLVRLRLTGVPVLAHEDGEYIGPQAGLAGAVSAVLVVLVLSFALGDRRMLGALVLTLICALCLTAGAAALVVGHLNLISIAFGVLCIGLGVDFGIHFCLRCLDVSKSTTGESITTVPALLFTANELRRPLVLCAITSSVAFVAFVPTGFVGMGELGLITACGLIASLLATFTVLPAALAWLFPNSMPQKQTRSTPLVWIDKVLEGRERIVLVCAGILGVLALLPATTIRFDADPLGVRDPKAESVQLLRELLGEEHASPLAMNVLVDDTKAARALAARLQELPLIGTVTTASDFLPNDQANAIENIEDTAFAVLPSLKLQPAKQYPNDEILERLQNLQLKVLSAADDFPKNSEIQKLKTSLEITLSGDNQQFDDLETRLMSRFPTTINRLAAMLTPVPVSVETLPPMLQKLIFGADGMQRIEINPNPDAGIDGSDVTKVGEFVDAVLELAPNAYGEGYAIREISEVVLRAFAFAFAIAAFAIFAISFLTFRDIQRTMAVVMPLAYACLFTTAICVVFGISLNFANVIVLPLLLGIGIDTAIHLVHRSNNGSQTSSGSTAQTRVLRTSAASAAFYSGLTTLVSFGTMAFARHQGLASLGSMLWIGVMCVLLANFILIPALLNITTPAEAHNKE